VTDLTLDAPITDSSVQICVFCGSNAGTSAAFAEAATELGSLMAQRGVGLVYGGGKVGLMGLLADAVLAAGGEVTGVIPRHLVDREVAHTGLTSLQVTESMHERKAQMAQRASGFIALPGGFGTFEETIEVLTWNQLGLMTKPVVVLDIAGFYAPLSQLFERAEETGFLRPQHRGLAQFATSVSEALDLAMSAAPTTVHKWIDLDRT
jgi:uncharacterized protein (TIGR00730 family)